MSFLIRLQCVVATAHALDNASRLARTPISPPAAMPAAQLAVKDRVFLLDLQTLCNKGSTAVQPQAHSARQRHQQQRRSQAVNSSAAPDQAEPLTHEQITTGQFIQDLFSAGGGSLCTDVTYYLVPSASTGMCRASPAYQPQAGCVRAIKFTCPCLMDLLQGTC